VVEVAVPEALVLLVVLLDQKLETVDLVSKFKSHQIQIITTTGQVVGEQVLGMLLILDLQIKVWVEQAAVVADLLGILVLLVLPEDLVDLVLVELELKVQ
jgi:hypothetical protein